jgi:hypothetical protein
LEVVAYLFFYTLFPINCWMDAKYRENKFFKTDWYYNIFSLSSKFSLFWLKVCDVERAFQDEFSVNLKIYLLGIALPVVVLLLGILFVPNQSISSQDTDKGFFYRLASLRFYAKRQENRVVVYKVTKSRLRP